MQPTHWVLSLIHIWGALAHAAAQSPAPAELLLSNRTPEKAQALAQQLGATVSDNETIAQTCDYIFLGVKPQMMADLLARLRPILSRRQEGFVLVSMAAGLTLQRLREMAGLSCPILRIMPNTACAVGAGLTLYVPSPEVTAVSYTHLPASPAAATSGSTSSAPSSSPGRWRWPSPFWWPSAIWWTPPPP